MRIATGLHTLAPALLLLTLCAAGAKVGDVSNAASVNETRPAAPTIQALVVNGTAKVSEVIRALAANGAATNKALDAMFVSGAAKVGNVLDALTVNGSAKMGYMIHALVGNGTADALRAASVTGAAKVADTVHALYTNGTAKVFDALGTTSVDGAATVADTVHALAVNGAAKVGDALDAMAGNGTAKMGVDGIALAVDGAAKAAEAIQAMSVNGTKTMGDAVDALAGTGTAKVREVILALAGDGAAKALDAISGSGAVKAADTLNTMYVDGTAKVVDVVRDMYVNGTANDARDTKTGSGVAKVIDAVHAMYANERPSVSDAVNASSVTETETMGDSLAGMPVNETPTPGDAVDALYVNGTENVADGLDPMSVNESPEPTHDADPLAVDGTVTADDALNTGQPNATTQAFAALDGAKVAWKAADLDESERVSVIKQTGLGCVLALRNAVRGYTEATRCPCLMRHALHSPSVGSAAVDFLVLPESKFESWRNSGFEDEPAYASQYTTLSATASMSAFGVDGFFFTSGNMFIPDNASFVLVVRSHAAKADCGTQVQFVFESAPVACAAQLGAAEAMRRPPSPLRLAPPHIPAVARVVGGTAVSEDRLLAASAVVRSASGECSASVVGDRWLLTAAHCGVRTRTRARVGGLDSAGGALHVVAEVRTHPDYFTSRQSGLSTHDVAVLKLDRPVETGARLALSGGRARPAPGAFARAAGYGQIAEGWIGHARARELRRVDVPLVDIRRCRRAFARNAAGIVARALSGRSHLCAGFVEDDPPCQGDTCTGDSGGPLVVREGDRLLQIGITSGGLGCGRRGLPGVYVNVSEYADWIKQATDGSAVVVDGAANDVGDAAEAVFGIVQTVRIPTWVIIATVSGIAGAILLAACIACCCCWCYGGGNPKREGTQRTKDIPGEDGQPA